MRRQGPMDHPITPPPELFAEWFANSLKKLDRTVSRDDTGTTGLIAGEIAIQAARWGADQELEKCAEWASCFNNDYSRYDEELRGLRRPKPPSLKERALQAWTAVETDTDDQTAMAVIRRALEALPE